MTEAAVVFDLDGVLLEADEPALEYHGTDGARQSVALYRELFQTCAS